MENTIRLALNTAKALVKWISTNLHEVELLQTLLTDILSPCIQMVSCSSTANAKIRAKMWSKYHSVRTSAVYSFTSYLSYNYPTLWRDVLHCGGMYYIVAGCATL